MTAPASPALRVDRLAPALRGDSLRLRSSANGAGWCRCVAWRAPTCEAWLRAVRPGRPRDVVCLRLD